ncbi:hypothetical protein DTO96_102115 [Ephemeroptericola cinctiostellae]|uniref:Uncharacterized protein n=1 Tax=Ephemeroptericola cinctiostellae TaxID=2268024 RepID=A0A345DDC3_9BURK|nr:hypothetical protein [Ephemeroptericola cinctiostellae]AXF86361.1 hypothetical protein DTO96_102115 [Ephemeroptericola cinctiostellae]
MTITEQLTLATTIITLVLAVITGIYAWITYKILHVNEVMVLSMKAQQDILIRAYIEVSIYISASNHLMYLTIQNTGKTAATKLKLSIDKDFYKFGDNRTESNNIRGAAAFQNEIDSLPPNSKLSFILGDAASIYKEINNPHQENSSPLTFKVSAIYSCGDLEKITEISSIDLRPYINTTIQHDPIVEELRKITGVLKKSKK